MTMQFRASAGFSLAQYLICLKGIIWREGLRFLHQRFTRFGAVAPDIQRRRVYRRPEPVTEGPSSRSVLTVGGN